jgi:hypothetical protein
VKNTLRQSKRVNSRYKGIILVIYEKTVLLTGVLPD